jgi:hypothetical protein
MEKRSKKSIVRAYRHHVAMARDAIARRDAERFGVHTMGALT